MEQEINKLFQTRNKAVKIKDKKLFLSTQLSEIEESSSNGYLELDNLNSEVLNIHAENDLQKAVFVKETYFYREKGSSFAFLIYFLVDSIKGWKIYKIK